jgi:hypothetical protein
MDYDPRQPLVAKPKIHRFVSVSLAKVKIVPKINQQAKVGRIQSMTHSFILFHLLVSKTIAEIRHLPHLQKNKLSFLNGQNDWKKQNFEYTTLKLN